MKTCFPSIIPILFDMIGIPNMVCGHTVDSWSMAYCFWVTVTLISGVSFREKKSKRIVVWPVLPNPFTQMCPMLDPLLDRGFYQVTKIYLFLLRL